MVEEWALLGFKGLEDDAVLLLLLLLLLLLAQLTVLATLAGWHALSVYLVITPSL
jgi:hypothetical protein